MYKNGIIGNFLIISAKTNLGMTELKEAILDFWTTKLTNQLCNKYIDHVYKVIPAVIKKNLIFNLK